jgi:hypothetical protein
MPRAAAESGKGYAGRFAREPWLSEVPRQGAGGGQPLVDVDVEVVPLERGFEQVGDTAAAVF